MSNVQKFEELLRSDDEIQAKLRVAAEAYDGDKADEKAVFDATVGKVAAEAGLPFSYEEGREHALEGVKIDDSELETLVSGGFCYGIGGDSGVGNGDCLASTDPEDGAGICSGVGGGLFSW